MQIGDRIIYDQDGDIIMHMGQLQGEELQPRKEITQLHLLELAFNEIDFTKNRIVSIDTNTNRPILEEIKQVLTNEQQQIIELEDALLLAADAEMGGIL